MQVTFRHLETYRLDGEIYCDVAYTTLEVQAETLKTMQESGSIPFDILTHLTKKVQSRGRILQPDTITIFEKET